jgi:CBS domain-containing protein
MNGYDEGYKYWSPVRAEAWEDPGAYGGMRSNALPLPPPRAARSEFGSGGGMYDVEYDNRARGPGAWHGLPYPSRHFDSERIRAGEIMTPDPEFVSGHATLAEASRIMAGRDVGIIPVVESDGRGRLIGVITDRDIAVRAVSRGASPNALVRDFMSDRIRSVHPETPLREVIRTMSRERIRRLPVVDRDGRLVGIISQADLAVDYTGFDPAREQEVEEMIERISEPGHPRERGSPYQAWGAPEASRRRGPFNYW